ncbi:metal-dependent hydrolase, putative [Trichomonas vaginalis G3]|uniref:Metal-dependent hydrolase, putative n=1 Tax=Trichomonas vaginalis (strain ATCC PRA-98 / G3) TaxID=412133 RepID=A2FHS1_TRIV3|nr:hydrolase activity, acting on carbon-nitrogen (but not peptide) bonds [Trichomonas vaginalis G3]EAX95531.1 metal-dependent hydrolase, putative [Trichomonas vaginalis G3]KAI5514386.1 hydrolase activity, acting on carbon-nitrogen (but not peptide) bonds [Trichomonas vaginalis G3]|eukprot:XP_001308461.1 metal-dependent hydrolase [Trichomonas vaginalis G3]
MRVCFHVTCVNSLGLSLANINENTPNPEGGEIEKDSNGKLTGIVKENAQYMVYKVVPKPTLEDIKKMLFSATTKLNQFGITSAQSDDFTCFDVPYDTVIQAYQELEKEGKLNVRINQQSQIKTPEALEGFISKGYKTGFGSDKFKIGPLKLLGDGSLGARTAFLQEPYSDDPSKIGILVYKQELLENLIKIAHNNNIQVAIHAIGDGIMKMLINTIEKVSKENPKPDIRHGIVHCQIMDKEILKKFTELKLLAFIDYDITIVKQRIGEERAKFSYNFKTLQDSGVNISNGSGCPVETPNPMAGIQCAVTRQDIKGKFEPYLPDQGLTIEEAIKSYTINGAYASFEENKKGQIKKDMISDFVIWDKDIFTCDVHNLHLIRPLKTYLGGKLVYQNV